MKIEISADNRIDLMNKLAAVDISVPPRSKGRTKDHCERWSICRLLSTYPNFSFPIKIIHRDKPDFLLKTFDKKMGIEHSEAIQQDYAHACAISENENNNNVVDLSLFKWGQKKNPSKIYEIANRTTLTGPGWEGDSAEIEWSQALYDIIQKKTILLRKNDFKKYEENALLIYDNLSLPSINYTKAKSLVRKILITYWNSVIIFNNIFIQTDALLIVISQEKINTFKTNNIW